MLILFSLLALAAGAREPSCEPHFSIDRPGLYRLSHGGRTSYLIGHRRDARSRAVLPPNVRHVIEAADVVAFETRPRAGATPAPELSTQLSPAAWMKLVERLARKGVATEAIARLSPALAYYLLEADPGALAQDDLDHLIRSAARTRGARIKALETSEEQERLITSSVTVAELEGALLGPVGDVTRVATYLRDDDERTLDGLRVANPALYRRLIKDRHRAWLRKIEGLHRRRGTTLFVLGRLHLGGPDGVLRLLAERGFEVERL